MKRNISCLLILVTLIFVVAIQAAATSTTYKLDELGLEVSIPSSYDVITQDTPTSSAVFSDWGLSGNELINHFKMNSIYLNAIPNNGSNEEIVVTKTDGMWDNFSAFSDTTIKTLASALISRYEDYGIVVSDYDVYQHSQAKFIKIYFTDSTNSVYGLQFHTIYESKTITFTMRSYSGKLSQKQEETITSIVDSIEFDTHPVSAPTVPETDSFVYTDVDTNTKFTVPANWYEKELSKDREFIDVKFVHNYESDLMITYGSVDLWSQMTYDEKKEFSSREEYNMSLFSELSDYELIQAFSCYSESGQQINKARIVSFNNVDYCELIISQSIEMYGYPMETSFTMLVHCENGWEYYFHFSGMPEDKYYQDFLELVNSVNYSSISTENVTESDIVTNSSMSTEKVAESDIVTNLSGFVIVFLILFSIAIIVIIALVIIKHNNKTKLYCHMCGKRLPLNSTFCHICGTKVKLEE